LDTYHRIQLKNTGYLTGKISKKINSEEIIYGTKIRNARQIQKVLARKKIWNRQRKPKKNYGLRQAPSM
jgi:hypothetical protein